MDKTKSLLRKLKPVTKVTPIPITPLTQEQKAVALPFLTEKKSTKKSIGKFFKKLTKATAIKKNNTEYKLTFIPIIKKNDILEPTPSQATEIVWTAPIEESADMLAQRIWDKDTTVCELETVVEYLGNGKPSSNAILKSYINHYELQSLSLEQAFRTLCSNLHLKGEAQQIDRILSEFAGRYFECNPQSVYGSVDVVHAILYSLLLLNTDLHVAQGDYKKMSRSEFIKNTMSAIHTPAFDNSTSFHSLDWAPLQRMNSHASTISSRSSLQSLDFPRPLSSYSLGSKTWQFEIKNILKHMYNNIRQTQLANPSTTPPASVRKVSSVFRRSNLFKRDNLSAFSIASSYNPRVSAAYTAPLHQHKEGTLVRKHLLEKKDQKAKHRDWKHCFMVVNRSSQLCMYAHKTSTLMGTLDLKHALASALPSGYSRHRAHAFTLELANGAVYVFQASSAQEVQDWVSVCNYWAARESKEPLMGGVSSMEYGWGQTSGMVYEWQAPAPPAMHSVLEESQQLETLRKYVQDLSVELDQHRDMKPLIEVKFAHTKYESRAMMNWENKSRYLLREIIKYQNYCNSIENSLQKSIMA